MDESAELITTICRQLELDWQYYEVVEAWNVERIADVRSAGRKAARRLGYKIMTHQTSPAHREDGRVVVIVAVREAPHDDARRMHERALLLMNDFWSKAPSETKRPD